ncbi:tetratricopeptide repeat protein [Streptomyces sp. NBC_00386]|uniref:tetratricopeptide repeat protein n=1 Tax=Streptomyces sp. NBC_00386 TaxID=2975734 RepID=UPI002E24FCBC
MHDERTGHTPDSALVELRRRLADGLARARLNQTQLAAQARLGRTTVSEALSPNKPVPSAETVAALARVLKLPTGELLELRRTAAEESDTVTLSGPGRPIGQWDPHALEVHPAGNAQDGTSLPGQWLLPGYVLREHDRVLAEAVRDAAAGRSRMLVLVGSSSTGKTRACWEAVQPLAEQGWRLWHPFDPTRAQAALEDLHRVGPRTVVWLNEAQHYLGDREAGEEIAAAVHHLLTSPQRGPVLALGTLWDDYAKQYIALPTPGEPDPHSRARELLAGRTVSVPDTFDTRTLASATALAKGGDRLLADALTRAHVSGRVAQDLAGAPELLTRYERATPAAKAILHAAMDARRLGVGLHLPQAFLTAAAADYLTDTDYDQLTKGWAEQAYAELAKPVHGKQAPLRSTTPRLRRRPPTPTPPANTPPQAPAGPMFRLADYLEQHGRTVRSWLCPPASFWHAALTHLTHSDDLNNLTEAAETRHRLQWAHHLRHRAADQGSIGALERLAVMREEAGDWEGAEILARRAAGHGGPGALYRLAVMRERAGSWERAEDLYRRAADHGGPGALYRLAVMRGEAGDWEGAEDLARQAADQGSIGALERLAVMRGEAGDWEGAEDLARQAADHGDSEALERLTVMRERAGDRESAEHLAWQAAEHGSSRVLDRLIVMREEAGDWERAENLARQAADHGSIDALYRLAVMREEAGDRESAENLYRQAAEHGDNEALERLAVMREEAGDWECAEDLARQAADHGNTYALFRLAEMRERAGGWERAEELYRQAADRGNTGALKYLAMMWERAGDRECAEDLARQAADRGDTDVLFRLAEMRERAGGWERAEDLYRQAADRGNTGALKYLAMMWERAGDRECAEDLARQAADRGDTDVLFRLAEMRERAGGWERAEDLYRQAADRGNTGALKYLAMMWERAGDRECAEDLARQAADRGDTDVLYRLAEMREKARDRERAENLVRQAADRGMNNPRWATNLTRAFVTWWPNGLDPDGTPTPPWK